MYRSVIASRSNRNKKKKKLYTRSITKQPYSIQTMMQNKCIRTSQSVSTKICRWHLILCLAMRPPIRRYSIITYWYSMRPLVTALLVWLHMFGFYLLEKHSPCWAAYLTIKDPFNQIEFLSEDRQFGIGISYLEVVTDFSSKLSQEPWRTISFLPKASKMGKIMRSTARKALYCATRNWRIRTIRYWMG